MTVVALTREELWYASVIGVRRRLECIWLGSQERNGSRKDVALNWYHNIIGAIGECTAAKLLKIPWHPEIKPQPKTVPDLPPDWQIRTLGGDDYDLYVRKDDPPEHKYVLVVGEPPPGQLRVVGWIYGHEARRPEWWGNGHTKRDAPCWWVPQRFLNPL